MKVKFDVARCCCHKTLYYTTSGSQLYEVTIGNDPDAPTQIQLFAAHTPVQFDFYTVEARLYYAPNLGDFYRGGEHGVPDGLLFATGYVAASPALDQPRGKLYHLNNQIGVATDVIRRNVDGTGAVTIYTASGSWKIRAMAVDYLTDAAVTPFGILYLAEEQGAPLEYQIKRYDLGAGTDTVLFTSAASEIRSVVKMDVAYHALGHRLYWSEFRADGTGARIQRAHLDGSNRETWRSPPAARPNDWFEDLQWEPRDDLVYYMQRYNPGSVPGVQPAAPDRAGIYSASFAGADPELIVTRLPLLSAGTGCNNFRLGRRFTPLG